MSRSCLTMRVARGLFQSIVIRWLGLILLVLSIHPPAFEAPDFSPAHSQGRAAAWALVTASVERHVVDGSVDACDDDDDQDDSVPPRPGAGPGGSDDDVLGAGIDWRLSPGMARSAPSPLGHEGLGPARGYSPASERPPRRS